MQNGKAVLLCKNYCDGLGDCLPAYPTGAITFGERETPTYNVAAAQEAPANYHATSYPSFHSHMSRSDADLSAVNTPSQLRQWPVQIRLAPLTAPYFKANLLVAADCTAFAWDPFTGIICKIK